MEICLPELTDGQLKTLNRYHFDYRVYCAFVKARAAIAAEHEPQYTVIDIESVRDLVRAALICGLEETLAVSININGRRHTDEFVYSRPVHNPNGHSRHLDLYTRIAQERARRRYIVGVPIVIQGRHILTAATVVSPEELEELMPDTYSRVSGIDPWFDLKRDSVAAKTQLLRCGVEYDSCMEPGA